MGNRSVEPVLEALWQGGWRRLAHADDPHPDLVLREVDTRQMRHRLLPQDHTAPARHVEAHRFAGGEDLRREVQHACEARAVADS
jgi:hypothetical protein